MLPGPFIQMFVPPSQGGYIKFGFDWPSGLGEDVLKIVDRRTDGWTQQQWYTISSPCEPSGSGELIIGGRGTAKLIERTK